MFRVFAVDEGAQIGVAQKVRETQEFLSIDDVVKHAQFRDPVYCLDHTKLRSQVAYFLENFPGRVCYAMKANPLPQILETMANTGLMYLDVASLEEMKSARDVSPDFIFHYHNPVKCRFEILEAYHRYGCRRFAVDCLEELEKIYQCIGDDRAVEIAVRFKLDAPSSAVHDFTTKFGATPEIASDLLRSAQSYGYEPLLTFHPGSQCLDVQAWCDHVTASAQICQASGVEIKKINIGGGFPSTYTGSKALDTCSTFYAIFAQAKKAFGGVEILLECEPGRALVATCASMITQVKLVRASTDDVFINDGVYGLFSEMAIAKNLSPLSYAMRLGGEFEKPCKEWHVFGPTCDPLDSFPNPFMLPEDIAEDDYLIFENVGAYGLATRTDFNGFGKVEIVELGENIVRLQEVI